MFCHSELNNREQNQRYYPLAIINLDSCRVQSFWRFMDTFLDWDGHVQKFLVKIIN